MTLKGNIFVALNPLTFVKESKAELEKVVWPTRVQTLKLTGVVLFVSILVGAYIAGLDAMLSSLVQKFIK